MNEKYAKAHRAMVDEQLKHIADTMSDEDKLKAIARSLDSLLKNLYGEECGFKLLLAPLNGGTVSHELTSRRYKYFEHCKKDKTYTEANEVSKTLQ